MQWARQPEADAAATKRFHPNISRHSLVPLGYIAAVSRHSRAHAVDLTLVAVPSPEVAKFETSLSYSACTASADKREPDNSIDMGTGFDCFDTKSHTFSAEVTSEQQKWRNTLVRAMERRGFRNYRREWWHYTYRAATGPAYDVPVTDRQAQPPR
jgi:D-alanyl-D-alanine dipeptidase